MGERTFTILPAILMGLGIGILLGHEGITGAVLGQGELQSSIGWIAIGAMVLGLGIVHVMAIKPSKQ